MTMTLEQFLERIYGGARPGVEVHKPNKTSRIVNVTESGSIYYLIGTKHKKAVRRVELVAVYGALIDGTLTNRKIVEIAGSARPCNVTTIQWMLREFRLAAERADGAWQRGW
jgi:hypothetical protein